MREKVGKSRNTVFPMICGSGGSKSRLAKAAGAEPAGQRSDEKLHAVVARSTFPSQNAQNTPCSDHFWKLRCQKSARHCGAKHISKSKVVSDHFWKLRCRKSARHCSKMYKTHHARTTFGGSDVEKVHAVVARSTFRSQNVTKHTMPRPLLEVQMSKKCRPLWREAHFEGKMYKTPHVRGTFGSSDVEKVHAIVARSTFRSQNVQNTQGFGPLLEVQMWLRFASLHYTTLHYTTLHYTTLHYTTLHYTTLHYITLHYTPLRYNYNDKYNYNYTTTLHYTKLHYTTLHYITLHYTTFHYTPLRYTQ